jgi:hypothetical protein
MIRMIGHGPAFLDMLDRSAAKCRRRYKPHHLGRPGGIRGAAGGVGLLAIPGSIQSRSVAIPEWHKSLVLVTAMRTTRHRPVARLSVSLLVLAATMTIDTAALATGVLETGCRTLLMMAANIGLFCCLDPMGIASP